MDKHHCCYCGNKETDGHTPRVTGMTVTYRDEFKSVSNTITVSLSGSLTDQESRAFLIAALTATTATSTAQGVGHDQAAL